MSFPNCWSFHPTVLLTHFTYLPSLQAIFQLLALLISNMLIATNLHLQPRLRFSCLDHLYVCVHRHKRSLTTSVSLVSLFQMLTTSKQWAKPRMLPLQLSSSSHLPIPSSHQFLRIYLLKSQVLESNLPHYYCFNPFRALPTITAIHLTPMSFSVSTLLKTASLALHWPQYKNITSLY